MYPKFLINLKVENLRHNVIVTVIEFMFTAFYNNKKKLEMNRDYVCSLTTVISDNITTVSTVRGWDRSAGSFFQDTLAV